MINSVLCSFFLNHVKKFFFAVVTAVYRVLPDAWNFQFVVVDFYVRNVFCLAKVFGFCAFPGRKEICYQGD